MRYINLRFTYLLTYCGERQTQQLDKDHRCERTCLVVVNDARADDLSTRREDLLKFQLRQRARQTADVQVGVLDTLAAWPGIRHLHRVHTVDKYTDVLWIRNCSGLHEKCY